MIDALHLWPLDYPRPCPPVLPQAIGPGFFGHVALAIIVT